MSKPILRNGNFGEHVIMLTTELVSRKYINEIRSVFDDEIVNAVCEFQARHLDAVGEPLITDGVVGPLTWWALENPDNSDTLTSPKKQFDIPDGGSEKGRAALRIALREIAAGAQEVGSNNSGPFVEKYLNEMVKPPANWCSSFVCWCYNQHPDGIPFAYNMSARGVYNEFMQKGWAYQTEHSGDPEPGDIIAWWRISPGHWSGHIGLVYEYSNGFLYTIEANKGGFPAPVNKFRYVLVRIDKLIGFGRVPDKS